MSKIIKSAVFFLPPLPVPTNRSLPQQCNTCNIATYDKLFQTMQPDSSRRFPSDGTKTSFSFYYPCTTGANGRALVGASGRMPGGPTKIAVWLHIVVLQLRVPQPFDVCLVGCHFYAFHVRYIRFIGYFNIQILIVAAGFNIVVKIITHIIQ